MIDQYGHRAPNDLVVLPDGAVLPIEEWETVMSMPWYECLGVLLISASDLPDGVEGTDHRDVFLEPLELAGPICLVQPVLHRYSEEDGFYHA